MTKATHKERCDRRLSAVETQRQPLEAGSARLRKCR